MSGFRNLNLQRTLSVFILFTALFSQIQTLYACDLMDGKPKHVCCCEENASASCPMADSCAMNENGMKNQCCEVSYETLTDAGMMNSASTVDFLTLLLDGPQPPPAIEFQPFSPSSLPTLSQHSLPRDEPLALHPGRQIYFLTRRLRL